MVPMFEKDLIAMLVEWYGRTWHKICSFHSGIAIGSMVVLFVLATILIPMVTMTLAIFFLAKYTGLNQLAATAIFFGIVILIVLMYGLGVKLKR